LRAGLYALTAARAVGAIYTSNRLNEGNRVCRTDILTKLAAGAPLGNNMSNQTRIFVTLFFILDLFLKSRKSFFPYLDLLFKRVYAS
jgi:hypothetical protein